MLNKKENKITPKKNDKSEKKEKKTKSKAKEKSQENKSKKKKKVNENKKTDSIKEKNETNKERIDKNITNLKFFKIDSKIKGDLDQCENFDEEDYHINLNDSLDQPKIDNDNKNSNNKIKSRNNDIKKEKKKLLVFKYPNSFNNVINNNLINKTFNKTIKKEEEEIFKEIIIKKRNQIKNSKNSSPGLLSINSTEDRTKIKDKNDNEIMITNNEVVEFNYEDEVINGININNNIIDNRNNFNNINNTISNNNTSFNVLNKETISENVNLFFTRKNTINNKEIYLNRCKELKCWLDNMNLSQYLDNFIQNDIYDINNLIEKMKYSENKLNYEEIESLLKIHKPGHIYRIFSSLQISAGLINSNVANFLIKKIIRHKKSKSKNNLKLSISQEIKENYSYMNCFRLNFFNSLKKNDLNQFLLRYNLNEFYQNFYHNGFDMINYIMVQMFSSEPINEIILENCFHIYEAENREKVLKCLLSEKEKIEFFLNSNEYLQINEKYNIKYEDIIFKKNGNDNNDIQYEKIIIPENDVCSDCSIF